MLVSDLEKGTNTYIIGEWILENSTCLSNDKNVGVLVLVLVSNKLNSSVMMNINDGEHTSRQADVCMHECVICTIAEF